MVDELTLISESWTMWRMVAMASTWWLLTSYIHSMVEDFLPRLRRFLHRPATFSQHFYWQGAEMPELPPRSNWELNCWKRDWECDYNIDSMVVTTGANAKLIKEQLKALCKISLEHSKSLFREESRKCDRIASARLVLWLWLLLWNLETKHRNLLPSETCTGFDHFTAWYELTTCHDTQSSGQGRCQRGRDSLSTKSQSRSNLTIVCK